MLHSAFAERISFLVRKRETVARKRKHLQEVRKQMEVPEKTSEAALLDGPEVLDTGAWRKDKPVKKFSPYTSVPGGGVKYKPKRYD